MSRPLSALLTVLLMAPFASVAALEVKVDLVGDSFGEESAEPPRVSVRIEPAGSGATGENDVEIVELEATPGRWVSLDLPTAPLWVLRANAEGYWSPELFLTQEEVRGSSVLRLYPTGHLEIPVESQPLGEPPNRLEARFEPVPGPGTAGSGLRGLVLCPVAERVARCELPAGRHDLRVAAPSSAPVYLFDVAVTPRTTRRREPIELVGGASVAGRVELESGEPPPRGTTVELAVASSSRSEYQPRLGLAGEAVEVDDRGFFQFRGLRPGVYRLVARAEGFAPARVDPVEARPDLESALREPMVLAEPARLSIQVDPAVDPWGEPWTVVLSHLSRETGLPLSTEAPTAAADGTLEREAVEPGLYRVTLAGTEETFWLREELEIRGQRSHHSLTVPLVEVTGTVERGGDAVSGRLWFGTRHGERRIVFDLDPEGEFRGILPSPGEWPVEWVPPDETEAGVTLRPVEVPEERRVELHLAIPETEIWGEVIDAGGKPVADATVRTVGRRGPDEAPSTATAITDREGRFRLSGMEPGVYAVHAEKGTARTAMSSVTVAEDRATPDLRLVLEEEFLITGRVIEGGSGVPGATVLAWPVFDGGSGAAMEQAVTGPTGEFTLVAAGSPGAWNFLVSAPNRASHMGTTAVSERDLVEIVLDPYPGTLVLEGVEGRGGSLLLAHGGTFLPVHGFLRVVLHGRAPRVEGGALVVGGLEPGEYALCDTRSLLSAGGPSEEACRSGVLAPFGELRLRAPADAAAR